MDDFFAHVAAARWPRQGRLHVYALPTDERRRTAAAYQGALGTDPAGAYGLGLVPPRWLHFTVQMLHPAVGELDQAQLDDLVAALRRRVGEVQPLTLAVGPPQASRHAVELWTDPATDEPWRWLVEAVRTAAAETLGGAALPPLGAVPHTSIAYGIGTGDSGAAMSTLKRRRAGTVRVPVETVQLVAVHQHPAEGYFSWDVLAELPLAAADRASATA